MIIKVDNKVIDTLNRIDLNEYFIRLFTYLVSSGIITVTIFINTPCNLRIR